MFGETVTFGRLLDVIDDPQERLALLASNLEDQIATVFRQTAMNRFEDAIHTGARDEGELSVERIGELWAQTQTEMLGDAVEVTEGYRTWWSYIPHFIGTPGYVYAYAYGQLLALSVYARYEEAGHRLRARATSTCCAPAARWRPRSSAASSASTSPTPGSGTAASTSSSAASRRRSKPRATPGRI